MPRFSKVQSNFSSGEFGPKLKGRTDLNIYNQGLDEMFNFFPTKEGPAVRRPGSTYLGQVVHLTGLYDSPAISEEDVLDVHFIPYQTNDKTAYIVAIVKLETKIVFQIYNYSPSVFSAKYTALSDINFNAKYGASTGNLMPYTNDIHKVQYAQYGDIMIITCDEGNIPPIGLKIDTKFSYTYLYYAPNLSGVLPDDIVPYYAQDKFFGNLHGILRKAYRAINSTDITMASTTAIIAGNTGTLQSSQDYFYAGMQGSYIKWTVGTSTYVAKINSITDAKNVNITCLVGPTTTTASKLWEIQAWNDYWGHPRCVTFFEQRLLLGSTSEFPDTMWGSYAGNIFAFMQTRLAQDLITPSDVSGLNYFIAAPDIYPYEFTPATAQINSMAFLTASRYVVSGTGGGVLSLSGGGKAVTPTNFQIRTEVDKGGSYLKTVSTDSSIFYASRDGASLYQLIYNDTVASLVAKDVSLQFKGIYNSLVSSPSTLKFAQLCYNSSRSIIFALLKNSTEYVLVSLVVDQVSDILGASKHVLAGSGSIVKTIMCAPNADTFNDNLVMCVKRGSLFCVEEIHDDFELSSMSGFEGSVFNVNLAYVPNYLDCAKINTGAPTNTISHPVLTSTNVDVIADGLYYPSIALDGSGIGALPGATTATNFIIGLPYTSRLKLLPLNEGSAGDGAGIVQKKKVDSAWFKYRNSKHFKFGADENGTLYDVEIEPALNTVNLYSGIKRKTINHSSDFEGKIVIETDKPYPLQILQVGYRGVTQEV